MTTPAFQRDAERRGGERGPAKHTVAAPGQPPAEPPQRLVVELLHGQARDRFHLRRRDPAVRQAEQFWRDLCLPESCFGVFSIPLIGQNHRPDEGDRRCSDLLHLSILARFATLLATKVLGCAVRLPSSADTPTGGRSGSYRGALVRPRYGGFAATRRSHHRGDGRAIPGQTRCRTRQQQAQQDAVLRTIVASGRVTVGRKHQCKH